MKITKKVVREALEAEGFREAMPPNPFSIAFTKTLNPVKDYPSLRRVFDAGLYDLNLTIKAVVHTKEPEIVRCDFTSWSMSSVMEEVSQKLFKEWGFRNGEHKYKAIKHGELMDSVQKYLPSENIPYDKVSQRVNEIEKNMVDLLLSVETIEFE